MDAPAQASNDVVESLRRRLEDYERWFKVLDGQMRVLERERQKLSAIVNHTDVGFVVVDSSLKVVWANDVFSRRFASVVTPGEILGETCNRVLCRGVDPCATCPSAIPFATGSVAHSEIRLRVQGADRHIYATSMPIHSPEGGVDQTIVMLQDVSDLEILRSSEEALRASEERFRSIFESAAAGMATVARDGSFLQVNPALCSYLGHQLGDLLRLKLWDVTHPEDVEPSRRFFTEAGGRLGRAVEIEKRYVRKDGAIVWGRMTASWIFDAESNPTYAVALIQDVTDRKRLEAELRQAEKISALGVLVSGVAHELNNPLAGVLGYAQLLLKTHSEGTLGRGLESINREAERCKRIVHNLQTFARKHSPLEDSVSINDILRSTLELRSYQLKVDDIGVLTDLAPDLSPTVGDPHQLQQVFLNIIINAHQAMAGQGRPGVLTLRTSMRGSVIIVEFEDNGPGIPSESLGRIFDPFFTTKEVGQGTGLGLSICYGIVKEHKGRIYASNAPRGGAVFTVEIPVRRPAASIRTEAEVRSAAPAVSSRGEILVVDDEEVLLDILSQALQMDGHRVESALNGASALRMIRQKRYDLIISDLKMPGMDGQELYEKVLEMDRSLARRIIFSTGDVVSPETRDFLDATGNAYLQKPFDIEQIRRVVITSLRVPPN